MISSAHHLILLTQASPGAQEASPPRDLGIVAARLGAWHRRMTEIRKLHDVERQVITQQLVGVALAELEDRVQAAEVAKHGLAQPRDDRRGGETSVVVTADELVLIVSGAVVDEPRGEVGGDPALHLEVGARAVVERHTEIEAHLLVADLGAEDAGIEDGGGADVAAEDTLQHVDEQRRLLREHQLEYDVERGVEREHGEDPMRGVATL